MTEWRAVECVGGKWAVIEHDGVYEMPLADELDEPTARLIAAAPALMSALNAMMTFYGMDEDKDNGACVAVWKQARAAIAKAKPEGE